MAFKYRRISRTIPEQLENHPPSVQSRCSKHTETALLVMNTLLPLLVIPMLPALINKGAITIFEWLYFALVITYGILQCVLGYILVRSVVDIRRYFIDKNAADFINTRMLIKHAVAFGIFLLAIIFFLCANIVVTFFPNPTTVLILYISL